MRAHRLCLAAASAVATACVTNPAPRGWLAPAEVVAREAYGGWITVDTAAEERRGWRGVGLPALSVDGELIAVDADTVFVMEGDRLSAVPTVRVRRAKLFAYDAQVGTLAIWGVLGTLSTVSGGAYAFFTLPAWIITATAAASSRSRAPLVQLSDGWERLRLYARFPQGLPPGIDRAALRPAPLSRGRPGWQ